MKALNSSCLLLILGMLSTVLGQSNQRNPASREELITAVATRLRSPENKDRAWAAYLAGKHGLREFGAHLIQLLATKPESGKDGSTYPYEAILDGLIQLDISVPAEILVAIFDAYPDQATILLARSPVVNSSQLMSIVNRQLSDEQWLAVCNLLTVTTTTEFTAYLMAQLKIHVSMTVVSRTDRNGYGFGGGMSGGRGCSIYQPPPPGFPPAVLYQLTTTPHRSAVVVAAGSHTVYYVRNILRPGSQVWVGRNFGSRDQYLVDYLAMLLGRPIGQLGFETEQTFSIKWKGATSFLREMASNRRQVEESHRLLVDELITRELLTPVEANTLQPSISISVHDLRKVKSPALPVWQ